VIEEEREQSTIEKYVRDIMRFAGWLKNRSITHENCLDYKEELMDRNLRPSTINGILSALNKFCTVIGRGECKVKKLRVQRKVFRNRERELTKEEYLKLEGIRDVIEWHLDETLDINGWDIKKALQIRGNMPCRHGRIRYHGIPAGHRQRRKRYDRWQRLH